MSAVVGYGRLGYNVGAWNTSPDAVATITGQQILPSVNFGFGWGRESWSEGAWNTNIGLVFTGNGVIFQTTGEQLNTALNFSIAQASAQTSITGINANANLAQGTGGISLGRSIGNDNDQVIAGYICLFDPSNTSHIKHYSTACNLSTGGSNNASYNTFCGGYLNTTSAINAIKLNFQNGNLSEGFVQLYGVN